MSAEGAVWSSRWLAPGVCWERSVYIRLHCAILLFILLVYCFCCCVSVCVYISFILFFYIGFSLFEALTFLVVERVTKLTQKPEVLVIVHR